MKEYRGIDNLVIAEITADTTEAYTTGTVEPLAPVAEVGKESETSTATSFYDNKPYDVIVAQGADTLTIITPPLSLEKQSELFGYEYEASSKTMYEGNVTPKYFAVGYRIRKTDGSYRMVWRNKCMFSPIPETSHTEDDSTDVNNITMTVTSIATTHEFDGKPSRAVVKDSANNADAATFFATVKTPSKV